MQPSLVSQISTFQSVFTANGCHLTIDHSSYICWNLCPYKGELFYLELSHGLMPCLFKIGCQIFLLC